MREEEKVKLVVAALFVLLILNSIIIFGTARDSFFEKKDVTNNKIPLEKKYHYPEKVYSKDKTVRDYPKCCEREYFEYDCGEKYRKNCLREDYFNEIREREKDYFSWGEYTQNHAPIGYTNDYKIYLKNKGESGYFNVLVYLETDERIKEYKFRRYIFSGDEEVFRFRELSKTKDYFGDWSYKIEN